MNVETGELTPEQFIEVVHEGVYLRAVNDSLSNFEQPPGSKPREVLEGLHRWYMNLGPHDRDMPARALANVADGAVFGMLCLIDNVRPVVDGFREELRLKVISGGIERPLMADEPNDELHGLFRNRVDDAVE